MTTTTILTIIQSVGTATNLATLYNNASLQQSAEYTAKTTAPENTGVFQYDATQPSNAGTHPTFVSTVISTQTNLSALAAQKEAKQTSNEPNPTTHQWNLLSNPYE